MPIARGTVTAVVGKGGTGKTTLSGLLVRHLVGKGSTPVLAIDADPAQSFGRVLGTEAPETLGGIREEILGPQSLVPAGMAKKSYLDLRVQSSIVESFGFDLLTMGRPEGPGCYCYVNNLLRESLDALADSYPWVVIDCEAGMEHLSRRTTKDVDYLFVVCNGSAASIETATRILDLIEELRTKAAHRVLVLNNLSPEADGVAESLLARIDTSRFEASGVIPHDPEIEAYERAARPFAELPRDTPAFVALDRILGELSE